MGVSTPLRPHAAKALPGEIVACSGPGCGVLMVYPEYRLTDDFLAIRATVSRCTGCSKHGGKGADGCKSAGVIEDLEFLLAAGENAHQIAPRVGYRSLPSLYRMLSRRGRKDLTVRLLASIEDAEPWPL